MKPSPGAGFSKIVTLLFVGLTIAYPFIIYLNIESVRPQWFATVILVLVILRLTFIGSEKTVSDITMAILAVAFCLAVFYFDSALLLKFYPVMMSTAMGVMFLISLRDGQTLIEKFARAGGKTPPAEAKDYLRGLNTIWGVLLLINGAFSTYTACFTSLSTWALYNGMIAYMLLAGFALLELCYRKHYKTRHNIVDE